MPEPIPMEKFRKARTTVSHGHSGGDDQGCSDFDFYVLGVYLQETAEVFPFTHQQLERLRRALREQRGTVLTFIRERVLPFINTFPDADMTTVGAEVMAEARRHNGLGVGSVCNRCLTKEEKARMSDDSDVTPISRDEADEQEFACNRCSKRL